MLLRARIVLPVSQPPIEDGAVFISGDRIQAIGRWADLKSINSEKEIDLGESILLPGLINAHCHLEYTHLAGKIPAGKSFPDWAQEIIALKQNSLPADYSASWLRGAEMLSRFGTTTVANVESTPDLLPDVWKATPLRVFSFLEMTGVKSKQPAVEILAEAERKIESCHSSKDRMGLSPHALYSTTSELMRLAGDLSRHENRFVTTHIAESKEEFQMFMEGRGAFFEWLKNIRDMSDCGGVSPVRQLDKLGVMSERFLGVHANYLTAGDAQLLAMRGASIVHCPQSHAYFRHAKFPFQELQAAGVNVCLGTDSLASTESANSQELALNLFDEMKLFSQMNPDVSSDIVLQMATMNGAKALGRKGEIGELVPQAFADLVSIPFSGEVNDVHASVVNYSGQISNSMVGGEWVFGIPN